MQLCLGEGGCFDCEALNGPYEFTVIMTLLEENVSRLEICRLCYEVKDSFVDIFKTMVFKEDCRLVDKLKDLYGVEASADDEMSKFICLDCVKDIKFQGNISYGLWSTLDYLLRMHEERKMEVTAFNIPKESLDFLFSEKKECFSQSAALPEEFNSSKAPIMECHSDNGMDCEQSEIEESVEYCWCSECNAEFLNQSELRVHLKIHRKAVCRDNVSEVTDAVVSNEEYKLISGERSLLRSRLCCSKCQREFKSEKGLVKHIKKYDFKCKPRNFECLTNMLKSLKSVSPKGKTLLNIRGDNCKSPLDSKILNGGDSSAGGPLDSVGRDDSAILLEGNASERDMGTHSPDKGTVACSKGFPIITSQKNSGVLTSHDGCHPSSPHSSEQDICGGDNNHFVEGDENQTNVAIPENSVISPHDSDDPDEFSPIIDEESTFGRVTKGIVICDYCNKSLALKSKLREHIVTCHLSIVVHKCVTCYNVFPSKIELRTHRAVHRSKSKYICTLCNDNFSSKLKMTNHLKEVHKLSQGCICGVCFLGFSSRAELGQHHVSHKLDKLYKCSKCRKTFLNKTSYNSHVRFCQLRRVAYKCEICGKKFRQKKDMDDHSNSHESVKRYACHLCPKRFTQNGQLHLHIRNLHLKLKPHECDICKKRFAARKHLKSHSAVHSDKCPFSCGVCDKTFKWKSQVGLHMRKVHP